MSNGTSANMDSTQGKESLRRFCKDRRMNLSAADVEQASMLVSENLQNTIDWSKVKSIHSYQAIEDQHEIDPQPFLDWLKDTNSSVEVFHQDLSTHFPSDQFDAVLVPCIASDKKGYRLGFGEGQYDKFLATQDKAKRLGLCYHNSLFEEIPNEPHDEVMDFVVTEKRIIEL